MSERIPQSNLEIGHEKLDNLHEAPEHKAEQTKQEVESDEHNHNIDKIQDSIHREALSAEEIVVGDKNEDAPAPILGTQRQLKLDAYKRTVRKVRSNLNATERTFSKVIHHRTIEPVSEIGSKTIARPSGILGGALTALVGSSIVLLMSKHYGFQYNLSVFVILLTVGFVAGISIELLLRILHRKRV